MIVANLAYVCNKIKQEKKEFKTASEESKNLIEIEKITSN